MKKRHNAELRQGKDGLWFVHIDLADGKTVEAHVVGSKQAVKYSHPERVPKHIKHTVVPPLAKEARIRNLTGK